MVLIVAVTASAASATTMYVPAWRVGVPDGGDRPVEGDLAAVELDAAGVLDGVDDVLARDRAEQAPVLAGLVGEREHRAVEELGLVLRARRRLLDRALLRHLRAAGGLERALRRRLGELAGDQVVAQVAL